MAGPPANKIITLTALQLDAAERAIRSLNQLRLMVRTMRREAA